MLADEIHQRGVDDIAARHFARTLKRICAAEKYDLAPQFAAAADDLAQDFGSLTKAFPFCRLPYAETWIELTHRDRPHFAVSNLHSNKLQAVPKRVGFLLTATREDLSAWKAHLFWNIDDPGRTFTGASTLSMEFDMLGGIPYAEGLEEDPPEDYMKRKFDPKFFGEVKQHPGWAKSSRETRRAMLRHCGPGPAEYPPQSALLLYEFLKQGEEAKDLVLQLAASDWAGEAAYLLATIGLMNARNATEDVPSDLHKLNRARAKLGKAQLFEHRVLKIHPRQQRRAAAEAKGGPCSMRGHFVAGHWKVRKTGIYFWRPFSRGDFSKGAVTKDYQLT